MDALDDEIKRMRAQRLRLDSAPATVRPRVIGIIIGFTTEGMVRAFTGFATKKASLVAPGSAMMTRRPATWSLAVVPSR